MTPRRAPTTNTPARGRTTSWAGVCVAVLCGATLLLAPIGASAEAIACADASDCPYGDGCTAGACAAVPEPEVIFGTNNWIELRKGSLPIVLSVPHGGYVELSAPTIPDRVAGCYDAATDTCTYAHGCGVPDDTNCRVVVLRDKYTQEVSNAMSDALAAKFGGRRPSMVINKLHRVKLDPNRPIDEAALGVPDAETAYNEYHSSMEAAVLHTKAMCGRALVVDMHGHAHPENWIELGYSISTSTLDNNVGEALNDIAYTSFDSLLSSPVTTAMNSKHEVIRGPSSLGALLEAQAHSPPYVVVPSPTHPGPNGGNYFNGGFITRVWGVDSYYAASAQASDVDALQIELPVPIRWGSNATDRAQQHLDWGAAFANVVGPLYEQLYAIDFATGAGCPLLEAECPATSSEVPGAYWVDGHVWDDACVPELHGSCPPADSSRQMTYTPPGGVQVTLTRRLDSADSDMRRSDHRC